MVHGEFGGLMIVDVSPRFAQTGKCMEGREGRGGCGVVVSFVLGKWVRALLV